MLLVTLEELKQHLNIDITEQAEDSLLDGYLHAAQMVVEHDINRPLADCDEGNGVIKLAILMLAATWYRDKEATGQA